MSAPMAAVPTLSEENIAESLATAPTGTVIHRTSTSCASRPFGLGRDLLRQCAQDLTQQLRPKSDVLDVCVFLGGVSQAPK